MANLTKIDLDDLKFGKVISFDIAAILKNNVDLLSLIVPIGEVVPIMVGIPGVPTPDSNIWQLCDGSEITNENSPLRSIGAEIRYAPDLRDNFIKVPQSFGNCGEVGGLSYTYIFRHNHAGVTGYYNSPTDVDPANDARQCSASHNHTIDYSFDYAMDVRPPFYVVKFFMRIQ
jgi:hypothetical protein